MSLAKLKEKYNPLSVAAAPALDVTGNDPEEKFTPADYDDHHDSSGQPVAYDAGGNRINGRQDAQTSQPIVQTTAHPSIRPALESWQDSAPVSRLSIYLKEHGASAGIKLCQSNGKPHLTFNPGLGCADMKTKRWQIANNITALLIDATDDLKYLIDNGLIDLSMNMKVIK
jgi:hypothetical protein